MKDKEIIWMTDHFIISKQKYLALKRKTAYLVYSSQHPK